MSGKVSRISRRAVLIGSGTTLAGVAAAAAGKPASVVYAVNLVLAPGAEPDEFSCRVVSQSSESGGVQEVQGSVRCGRSTTLRTTDVRADGSRIEAIVEVSADASGQHARATTQVIDRGSVVRFKHSTIDLPRR